MEKTGIVILNYETFWETINCVDSIKRHKLIYSFIVIVDNASQNDSCAIFERIYGGDAKIHILRLEQNEGFAGGNNAGILYLRNRGISHILLLNSDTIILDDDYLEKMLAECKENVGVIGSKIYLQNGFEQAGEQENLSLKYTAYRLARLICRQYRFYFPFQYDGQGILKKLSLRVHGCAILLTPAFFQKYDGLWPYTFLYCEEMILSIMMDKAKLKTKIADVWIFHKASMTTGRHWGEYSRERERLEMCGLVQQMIVKILPYKILRHMLTRGL